MECAVYTQMNNNPLAETSRRVYTKVIRVQESHLNRILCLGEIRIRLLSFDTIGACMQNVDLGTIERPDRDAYMYMIDRPTDQSRVMAVDAWSM